jgi:hypothetical protein
VLPGFRDPSVTLEQMKVDSTGSGAGQLACRSLINPLAAALNCQAIHTRPIAG